MADSESSQKTDLDGLAWRSHLYQHVNSKQKKKIRFDFFKTPVILSHFGF